MQGKMGFAANEGEEEDLFAVSFALNSPYPEPAHLSACTQPLLPLLCALMGSCNLLLSCRSLIWENWKAAPQHPPIQVGIGRN
jgi:hypothetical protein